MPRPRPSSASIRAPGFRFAGLVLAVMVLGTALWPRLLAAQSEDGLRRAVRALPDSAVVRVVAPGVYVDPGVLLGVVGDSLRLSDADVRLAVGFDELEELAVRRSRWLGTAAMTGGIAALFGAVGGFFIGTKDCDAFTPDGCGRRQVDAMLRYGGVLGGAGGVVGALVGSRMTSWRIVFP